MYKLVHMRSRNEASSRLQICHYVATQADAGENPCLRVGVSFAHLIMSCKIVGFVD